MKVGLKVELKGDPSLKHIMFVPSGLQPARMCRNPTATYCAGP
jgi:hypothetical protein